MKIKTIMKQQFVVTRTICWTEIPEYQTVALQTHFLSKCYIHNNNNNNNNNNKTTTTTKLRLIFSYKNNMCTCWSV